MHMSLPCGLARLVDWILFLFNTYAQVQLLNNGRAHEKWAWSRKIFSHTHCRLVKQPNPPFQFPGSTTGQTTGDDVNYLGS